MRIPFIRNGIDFLAGKRQPGSSVIRPELCPLLNARQP